MSLNKSKALRTAEKYVLQGKISAAIDEYRKVVEADPTDLTTINTLGDLYVRMGRIQDAIFHFSRIAESYRESGFTLKAIAMYKKISKLDPTNVDTAMKLANLYSQQGLFVEARQQYLQVADSFAKMGQTRKALEAYQKIADLDPSNTAVRMKLGEIYSREGMTEQAHDAFIMAGAEFMRKGDLEQALAANLKAVSINPDSRQALTAIATIYTEQGQVDRAINILCDAFEKNPADVELLTILGRTYLSAGLMDEAERTFLSLVELDRNRYHYLLEVGRLFLQKGNLDRAAEQIDGCLDVLISKREEDKAIDFLRRILDRDMNHVGALKRLAQIFLRIREDHNLIATLNSLAEAAMRKGDDQEAIAALKELVRLEPDEPMHRQRLYNLGVRELSESDAPDMVRATGPLDYESAAFDDTFVIRQISEAEILAGHGQIDHAVYILEEILHHAPENVQVHLKLKDIYLRAGIIEKAANECLELARLYEARGETSRANEYRAEAYQINPLIEPSEPSGHFCDDFDSSLEALNQDAGGFQVREVSGGLDLSRYNTGTLTDQMGFVTLSPEAAQKAAQSKRHGETQAPSGQIQAAVDDAAINKAGSLPLDTMAAVLRDELEGVDFYIAQGYTEIAQDTLLRLKQEHGDHPEILLRYRRLGITDVAAGDSVASRPPSERQIDLSQRPDFSATDSSNGRRDLIIEGAELTAEKTRERQGERLEISLSRSPAESEHQHVQPFLIHKETGPLSNDLMVNFNTSELMRENLSDFGFTTNPLVEPEINQPALQQQVAQANPQERFGTAELIESIVSDFDTSFDQVLVDKAAAQQAEPVQPEKASEVYNAEAGLEEILEELKAATGDLKPLRDYETHYSLGLAYKDMDLLDEAIEQFQMAFRMAQFANPEGDYFQCCHMLGVCFKRKGMAKLAVLWFQRGLKIQNRSEDEYQALRYEIGLCYEEMGEIDKAIEAFMEVYALDVNYREVGEKLRKLQSEKRS
jgi:tetratricopeptide (TPR) repeat protein